VRADKEEDVSGETQAGQSTQYDTGPPVGTGKALLVRGTHNYICEPPIKPGSIDSKYQDN